MAWKNGGGETAEIAVYPPAAALSDFEWRVSMATVASDGPFSLFGGTDRTICVLRGAGLDLDIEGQGRLPLTPDSPPLSFPADVATHARLLDGPVTDLNVMTRRNRWRHDVRRIRVQNYVTLGIETPTALIQCCGSAFDVDVEGSRFRLSDEDALLLDWPVSEITVAAETTSLLCMVLLRPA